MSIARRIGEVTHGVKHRHHGLNSSRCRMAFKTLVSWPGSKRRHRARGGMKSRPLFERLGRRSACDTNRALKRVDTI